MYPTDESQLVNKWLVRRAFGDSIAVIRHAAIFITLPHCLAIY